MKAGAKGRAARHPWWWTLMLAVGLVATAVGGPIAMAYVSRPLGEPGTTLQVDVRGKMIPVTVTRMPFTPQRYYRG